ncbi:MAG: chorismate synthase [Methanobrevibacter thaueri]|jgi:chorismate synthase|uniref:chorismate synthase n=1 Tax=Methanobrevibacter thaueri TaxID=190975 RepID=UPI0026F340DA|nr:chorismate synthase [Methanobrevibacter thaueri]MBE6495663.1 chorismate synthase [Methanobrevibacter thaueri]
MSNSIGEKFQVTSFGASHGPAVGAIIDGCPANLELTKEDIQKELNKRKPGTSSVTTPRKEDDEVQILSGIFNGKTDGTPITGVVFNKNQKSKDYSMFKDTPRPSHGDYGWMMKYGNYDYNGGGRGSGRVTIGHVIGGAIAKKLLKTQGIEIVSHVTQIGDIKAEPQDLNTIKENIEKNPVRCADLEAASEMEELILAKKQEGDSIGGIVETIAVNVPAGLGEPVFERLDGDLARILMNIGAVKGVEIGLGFDVATHTGSEINDAYEIIDGKVNTKTNNSGGIIGGMSNGMPIVSRIAVKPTPSISKCQDTINLKEMENKKIEIKGRHDPCICPRVTVVAESSTAIILADHMIRSGFIHPSNLEC